MDSLEESFSTRLENFLTAREVLAAEERRHPHNSDESSYWRRVHLEPFEKDYEAAKTSLDMFLAKELFRGQP